jgi:hypothetical protein
VENHRKGKCLPNRPLPFSTDSGIPQQTLSIARRARAATDFCDVIQE